MRGICRNTHHSQIFNIREMINSDIDFMHWEKVFKEEKIIPIIVIHMNCLYLRISIIHEKLLYASLLCVKLTVLYIY